MASEADIRFGTDGWRGVIARDFTFAGVARVGTAIARYLEDELRGELAPYRQWGVGLRPGSAGILVGYDTRFLSSAFAEHLAKAAAQAGVPAQVTSGPVPTPALSWAVVQHRLAAGVMITASHNPFYYNGVKVKPEYGGSATEEITRMIERRLPPSPPGLEGAIPEQMDIRDDYLAGLRDRVDLRAVGGAPVYVVVDPMYGSARGYVATLLRGARVPYVAIRSSVDPLFGGKKPEPLLENLAPLKAVIRSLPARARRRIVVGLVTDGDGDRAAAMDERGEFLDTHRTAALILWHLIRHRQLTGKVLKSFALTDMVRKLAEGAGLTCEEIKIGFKWAVGGLVRQEAAFAGEESGGYGFRFHLPERDGILSGLLLLELVAHTGKSLATLVRELFRAVGPHHYDRVDLQLAERHEVVDRLAQRPPDEMAGRAVVALETLDGVKLRFRDGWLLLRASGTEPILRLYCEMASPEAVRQVLEDAERMVKGGLTL
ncbi:MAG: phosphoglucomutase/phosphomannomutase family protein [Candidatus Bipolaricaulaceae bacterium]